MEKIETFISTYLIPAYEQAYTDSQLRADFRKVVEQAEKDYIEVEEG